ncbi:MAG: polyphosphate kinase 2 family protein [Bacteroidia bacterium]
MHSLLNDPEIAVHQTAGIKLSQFKTDYKADFKDLKDAKIRLKLANKKMNDLQRKLYAADNHSVLLVFQAMDAAGKDSTIRSVFSGLNPTGFQVSSFKAPSKKELDHDYLWRCQKALPERGRIGIFNRSHYEEVLVCKVHPEYVVGQNIPGITEVSKLNSAFWNARYEQISDWEKHLAANGTVIMKFFLNVSKEEQKNRFLSRINTPRKNWKFSYGDMKERALWSEYQLAYEDAISATAREFAPWFVIPADNKTYMRALVAEIVVEKLEELNLHYPQVDQEAVEEMKIAKEMLENE